MTYAFSPASVNYRLNNLLVFEVLHQALHVLQLSLQPNPLISKTVQLSAQVGNVGLKHGINVGT